MLTTDLRFTAGEVRPVEVEVENLGSESWPWGAAAEPPVFLSYHWRRDGRELRLGGLRAPLPHPLGPGEATLVAAPVEVPAEPGRYELAVDLVRENVRWFGCETGVEVEVRPHLRVGVLTQYRAGDFPDADEETAELLERVVAAAPDYAPVVVGPRPDELRLRYGHDATESPRHLLLHGIAPGRRRALTLVRMPWRERTLRRSAVGRELGSLDALVIAPLDEPAERLELWLQAATAATARAAGVRVVLAHRPAEGPQGRLARRLARSASAYGLERIAAP